MDDYEGHECDIVLPGLRIELLPWKSTLKLQTSDLGLISHSKIRYRTILLRSILNKAMQCNSGDHQFLSSSNSGKFGLRNGHLPHVGNAVAMFNDSWTMIKKKTVLKRWVKTQCLSENQVQSTNNFIAELNGSDHSAIIMSPVEANDFQEMFENINSLMYISNVSSPIAELVPYIPEVENVAQFLEVLDTDVPEDE